MADEIDPDLSPGRDRLSPRTGVARRVRQRFRRLPPGPRLVIPTALLLAAVIAGFYLWMRPAHDDWSHLPGRLVCQAQPGPAPPPSLTVASVGVSHPRGSVLQLVIRFAQPLPHAPGYAVNYAVADNGTTFAILNTQQGTDELAIHRAKTPDSRDVRADKATHAAKTAPDAVEISLELTRFGLAEVAVKPALAVSAQLNAPPVTYATQNCRA